MGRFSFLPFVGIILVFIVYAVFRIPETKGKSYSEISLIFTVEGEKKNSSRDLSKPCKFDSDNIESGTDSSYGNSAHM